MLANKFLNCTLLYIQAIDHIINSAAKSNYMSAGQIYVHIVFTGPNGAAVGVGAQHSQSKGILGADPRRRRPTSFQVLKPS
uniref:Pyruvate dehydrogenase E1 component subunit beta n=1 Tax=Zea mays TaxID=4577 RepID=B6UFN4_MAIZE|nr:hypothetical protein [Zea mays]